MSEKPTGVNASKSKKEFTVTWDDGHTSVYSFGLLRAACPCASCRGGHENMKSEPDAEVFMVRDGPQTADGYTWWYLVAPYDETRAGWAAADFLVVVPSP